VAENQRRFRKLAGEPEPVLPRPEERAIVPSERVEPTPPEPARAEPERGAAAPEEYRARPAGELEREAVPGGEVSRPTKAWNEATSQERTSFI
jgi:hypothetical protein